MNLNQSQARMAGMILLALGVAAIFNLWWTIPAVLLAIGGVVIYRRQKSIGRTNEAVQGALWGLGLALLLLVDFIFPGVLLLGGASLLLRGHEAEAEARVLALVGRFSRRRAPVAMPVPQATVSVPQPRVTIVEQREQPANPETVRLS